MDLRWILLFTLTFQMRWNVESVVYPSIHWSPQNPILRENDTVHYVLPMSKINIVCPNPSTVVALAQDPTPKDWLYENLWIVSREAYDACDTTVGGGSRLLLKCMSPLKLAYYTLVFQQYSAALNGLEFQRDKEYYFIATSTGVRSSLDSTSGGNCKKNNMRLKFHVCRNSKDHRCNSKPSTNQPPASVFSEAPLLSRTTVPVVTSPLPTRRRPSTHEAKRSEISMPSTTTAGSVRKTVDTSDGSVELQREEEKGGEEDKPSGDVISWKMILLALFLLSFVGNVALAYWLIQRKLRTPVEQDKQKTCQHESNQGQQSEKNTEQEHAIDVERTLDRNLLPILRETTNKEEASSSIIVGLRRLLQRCSIKSTSSYNVQTVTI